MFSVTYLADTWDWDGSVWTLRATAGPAARYDHAMAFDPARGSLLVYGGTGLVRYADQWLGDATSTAAPLMIAQHPMPQTVAPGQPASFHVVATGHGPLSYRWRRNSRPLSDGGEFSGVTTPDLLVNPATCFNPGTFDVIVSDSCGSILSTNAFLSVVPCPFMCYTNCDGSTVAPVLNVNDFICFNERYAAGDSWANCDASTTPPILNVLDFVCFLNAFAAGCS